MSLHLPSQSSNFVFSLPTDFVGQNVIDLYKKRLKNYRSPYDNILDYLNSTVKDVLFPGMSIELPMQHIKRGKEITWKSSQNVYDLFTKEIDVTFQSVNSHFNYFVILDFITNGYLDTTNTYQSPLMLRILDENKDGLFDVRFRSVNFKGLSELRLNYSELKADEKTFTMTFAYNFLDLIFLEEGKDVIQDINI